MAEFFNSHPLRAIAGETKDCTVLAFTSATGLSYETAHAIAKDAGRRDRCGFWSIQILYAARKRGLLTFNQTNTLIPYAERYAKECALNAMRMYARRVPAYPTLASLMPKLKTGRHIVETRGHAFAVVDGVIMDNSTKARMRCRVMDVFTVTMTDTETAAWRAEKFPTMLTQSDISAMWERLNRLEAKL